MSLDPTWVQIVFIAIQSIFTVVLVIVTIFYVRYTREVVKESKKTREAMWKLEEKKFIQNKNRLRKAIIVELNTNCMIYEDLIDIVENYRKEIVTYSKNISKFSKNEPEFYISFSFEDPVILPDLKFPITSTYDRFTVMLGDLGKEELSAISYAYRNFIENGLNYEKVKNALVIRDISFKEFEKLTGFVEHLEVKFIPEFCIELETWYEKLFEGEINEKELEKKIKNFFKEVGL